MKKELFSNVDFSLAESVVKLGPREKNAVRIILAGLRETRETGKKQNRIKITITPDNLFNLRDFAQVMHKIGIDISSSMATDDNNTNSVHTFQPKPYGHSDFLRGIIVSKEATDHFIASFIDYEPSKVNSKPL